MSAKERAVGDQLLQRALKEDESLNMDLIWDIIDHYQYAVQLARNGDVEQEAIACSRLGVNLYIFKDQEKKW